MTIFYGEVLLAPRPTPNLEENPSSNVRDYLINLLAPDFFLILAHPVYKMWIMQEPNKLELWNKLHFEKEKPESIYHV